MAREKSVAKSRTLIFREILLIVGIGLASAQIALAEAYGGVGEVSKPGKYPLKR